MRRTLWLSLAALSLLFSLAFSRTDGIFTFVGSALMYFAALVAFALLYLAPGFLALHRRHQNTTAIVVLNVLTGWTLFGWIGSMVWASTAGPQEANTSPQHAGMRIGGLLLGLLGIMLIGYGIKQFGSLEAVFHAINVVLGISFIPFLLGWIPLLAGGACTWGSSKLLRRSGFFTEWT
jgi:hypothetical protein